MSESKCRVLSPASVKQLFATMAQMYDTEICDKMDSAEMKLAAKFFDAIGVMDAKDFLTKYATTIDHRLYLPFTPGSDKVPLLTQVMTCAHEHQHVVVMEDEGYASYHLHYVASPAMRAMYEARCYQAGAEVCWWKTKAMHGEGTLPDIDLAKTLRAYGCDAKASAPALKSYVKACKVIQKGGVGCQAAQDVISFFGWMGCGK
jgi:hypothetical protein